MRYTDTNHKKTTNAWKRYGVLFMAGMLLAGTGAAAVMTGTGTVLAEEEEERITLRTGDVGDDGGEGDAEDDGGETEAADDETEDAQSGGADEDEEASGDDALEETETESETEKETFAQIDSVKADTEAVVATDVSDVVEDFMPAMVAITQKSVESVDTYYYGVQEYETEGAASGIIIAQNDDELLIATNSHVVEDSTEIKVWFTVDSGEDEAEGVAGKIKGMDREYELAVVAVRLSDIPKEVLSQIKIATLGSSSKLKVGQTAIAVGNELGYGQSVTCGVISALSRQGVVEDLNVPLILMDTAINFGSSGGAVLNSKGQVIGISVAKETGTGSEGMGYAIPIDEAIPVLERLANKETRDKLQDSERGYIGASVVDVNSDAKELYDMPSGAFVYSVEEGSAAEEAGIKKGDIITKFDGESVSGSEELIEKISYYNVGETVTLEVQTANDGKYETREVEVTLQAGADTEDASQDEQEEYWEDTQPEEQEEADPDQDQNQNDFFGEWNEFQQLPFIFGGNGDE